MPPKNKQVGLLGEGGYNVIMDVRHFAKEYAASEFLVDVLDVSSGELRTSRFRSASELLTAYSYDDIVVRSLKKASDRRLPVSTNRECLTAFLMDHWNRERPVGVRYTRTMVSSIIKRLPEWDMLWMIFKRGIYMQHAPLDEFTTFHVRSDSLVTLCIRTTRGVYQVLRRFDGDMGSLRFVQKEANLGIVLSAVESILKSLTYFTMYGVFHHHDIKPSNILWRKNANGTIDTRLADYDTLVSVPEHLALYNVDMSMVTEMFASPLRAGSKTTFINNFEYLQQFSRFMPADLRGREVMAAWEAVLNSSVDRRKKGGPPRKCDLLDTILTKNDLYSIGCFIACFDMQTGSMKTQQKVERVVVDFIRDLIMPGPVALSVYNPDDDSIGSRPKVAYPTGIMSISDASTRLAKVRKSFTAAELVGVKMSTTAAMYWDDASTKESSIPGFDADMATGGPKPEISETVLRAAGNEILDRVVHSNIQRAIRLTEKERADEARIASASLNAKEIEAKIRELDAQRQELMHSLQKCISMSSRNVATCPHNGCNGVMIPRVGSDQHHLCCSECTHVECEKCGGEIDISTDHKCDEDAMQSLELIRNSSRPCPNCNMPIQKVAGGCSVVTCTSCQKVFNWITGQRVNVRQRQRLPKCVDYILDHPLPSMEELATNVMQGDTDTSRHVYGIFNLIKELELFFRDGAAATNVESGSWWSTLLREGSDGHNYGSRKRSMGVAKKEEYTSVLNTLFTICVDHMIMIMILIVKRDHTKIAKVIKLMLHCRNMLNEELNKLKSHSWDMHLIVTDDWKVSVSL